MTFVEVTPSEPQHPKPRTARVCEEHRGEERALYEADRVTGGRSGGHTPAGHEYAERHGQTYRAHLSRSRLKC